MHVHILYPAHELAQLGVHDPVLVNHIPKKHGSRGPMSSMPCNRCTNVLPIVVKTIEPILLVFALDMGLGSLHYRSIMLGMTATQLLDLISASELLPRILPDSLQHGEPRLIITLLPNQTLVDQGSHPLQQIQFTLLVTYRVRCF